ncbi:RNA ligase family protein [Dyadobacter sp. CY323]|uniref:RNA ligase family protein n=1 Tax=Dyadobacter sp. CY323 TaxID=2907302 RepID=UPI001F195AEA|nr:RNA ligase family protein [Dyadobacter sp. CY323]MCE6992272.1 2'-5' RNA ligase [Dyadobacter sp. CY323]
MKNTLSDYEKIASSFKDLAADEIAFNQLNKLEWVATEKIHGAHFRFIYQDKKLLYGKRRELLEWHSDFFGFQMFAVMLETQVTELLEAISRDFAATKIIIYGELFGGIYPHPDIQVIMEVSAIQTGIFYSPDIRFYAYDIATEDQESSIKKYLSYETAIAYFQKFDIPFAVPLKKGKLSEVLNFDLRMESPIPFQLGLPPIPANFIEGIVIKPFGDIPPGTFNSRPILKIKNPEFQENERFHQAQKWSHVPQISTFSEELDFILPELRKYITLNRLNSAISKIGSLSSENNTTNIVNEFLEDVFTDFNHINDNLLHEFGDQQIQWLNGRIKNDILHLIATVINKTSF